jgi:hypothetical protein
LSRSGRIAIVLGMFAVVAFLVIWTAFSFVGTEPATVSFVTGHKAGAPVHLVAQTDGAVGTGAHPTWVSYQVKTPHSGNWVHTTLWQLPANTRINVTIYQFDSGSPLRNQQWGRVTGTIGGSATLTGTTFQVLNSYKTTVGHTFTVPTLGINVPLRGNKTTAKNFCTSGPCNPATQEHHTITFAFKTPKMPGNYRFQCFIPCGAGHYAGNGGPMQTLGYMGGFLEVQA